MLSPSEAIKLLETQSRVRTDQAKSMGNEARDPGTGLLPSPEYSTNLDAEQTWFSLKLGQDLPDASEGIGLLIGTDSNQELIEAPEICAVPFSPDWLKGYMNVRSHIVPVIRLENFLGLQMALPDLAIQSRSKSESLSYVLHFERGPESFAITIQHFPKKINIPSGAHLKTQLPLPDRMQSCIGHHYRFQGIWCEWHIDSFCQLINQASLNAA